MGDNIQIRLARKNGAPIAAMPTLRQGSSVIFKYGCSDEKIHNLGAMPFLFWRLIEESKALGAEKIDFGRSDLNQESLITFKNKFGAARRVLRYYRYPKAIEARNSGWDRHVIRQFFSVCQALFHRQRAGFCIGIWVSLMHVAACPGFGTRVLFR